MTTTTSTDDRGATLHYLASGHKIRVEGECPDPRPANIFSGLVHAGIAAVTEAADKLVAVDRDSDLSVGGKEKRFTELRSKAVAGLANVVTSLNNIEDGVERREAKLLEVPGIAESNTVAAIEARQIRDWWKTLPSEERAKLLQRIDSQDGHETIALALLHSPVRMLDHEVQFARRVERTRRLADPATAVAIEIDKSAIEWTRRSLAHATGTAALSLKLDPQQTLRQIAADHPTVNRSLGFDDGQIAGMQRRLEAEKTAIVMGAAA